MDAQQENIARECLHGAYDDTISFPDGVKKLMEAGFEGYHVDYRLNTRTYYLADGGPLALQNPHRHNMVGTQFNQPEIAAAIRWAQDHPPDYSYISFNEKVTAHGCAGYIVSILGRRVLYFGRTAETHVEMMPGDEP